jgi:hypothetical protein
LYENVPEDSVIDKFAAGFHDTIQIPLQVFGINAAPVTQSHF